MNQHKKFSSGEEHEHKQETTQSAAQEFSTVEELLRHDAAQVSAPAGIAERLQKSSANFPKPSRPWWQKLFGH